MTPRDDWQDGFVEGQVVGLVRALVVLKRQLGDRVTLTMVEAMTHDAEVERDVQRRRAEGEGLAPFVRAQGCAMPGWRRWLAVWRAL